MAAGATNMSNFNYFQNGKYGTLPQNSQKDMEVSQDMHLKMSKKIAQLTKVIYALNTKNDEHDTVIQNIKEKHEEQIQQIYAETKTKVDLYKQKIQDETEHMQKVETLQKCILDHEKEKEKAIAEFADFKQESAQRESQLKTGHSEKMLQLSQEVLIAKKEFEARLALIDSIREELLAGKEAALQEMEVKHRKELEEVHLSYKSERSDLSISIEQIEGKYKSDIERLHMDIARLSSEKKQVTEEYEGKLAKAQAFYDKELEVLRNSQNDSHEEQLTTLQERYEKLKKDSQFAEGQHQKRVDDLIRQIALKEEDTDEIRKELEKLRSVLKNSDSNSSSLNKKLQEAQNEASQALTRLKQMEAELIASRERCEQQAQELLKKSTNIGELEATKLQHESTIQDLKNQLEKLKDRIGWLEGAKRALESKTQAQTDDQINQFKSLQQSLEDMSIEKQKLREQYEREIISIKETASTDRQRLLDSHTANVDSLTKEHRESLSHLSKDAESNLATVRLELETLLEEEKSRHRTESLAAAEEYEKTKTELTHKLRSTEDELRRLNKAVQESKQGLGSAASQMNSLREMSDRLKAELEQTRMELRTAKSNLATVQADHNKLKITHESKMTEAQVELKNRLEQLAVDLDIRWKETLRKECQKLRREITEQKDEDKRAALEQLTRMKEDEFSAARQGWENKIQELLEQISGLRSKLDNHEQSTSEEMDRLRQAAEDENKRLAQEMLDSAEEYSKKITDLEAMYTEQLNQLTQQKERETRELESRLRQEHMDDVQATGVAHKSQLSSTKEELERKRHEDLDGLRAKHGQRIESLRTEMEHKHSIEIEQMSRDHQQQIHAARMELDRSLELSKQKEGEHAMKCSELEEQIQYRETSIRSLEEEIRRLQQGVKDMAHELETKGKDILRIRSEANTAVKLKEDELAFQHQSDLDHLTADHLQETQDMLGEFSKAQDLLKDKISELQMLLEEAEDRYRNRDPRPEDLRLIRQLEVAVQDRENAVQKVLDDKKFYQMELVNRETNFNKVFNAAPNVGVMNPLLKKAKKSDPPPMKFSSSPALSNRLDPLPGSPLHDGSLNHMRPLPPATKKFIR